MNMQKDITRWKQDSVNFQSRILELQKQREKYGIELSQAGFAPISQAFRPVLYAFKRGFEGRHGSFQANAKYFACKEELKNRGSDALDIFIDL